MRRADLILYAGIVVLALGLVSTVMNIGREDPESPEVPKAGEAIEDSETALPVDAAAGAVELEICILTILNGLLPPTINLEDPDPECDLDYVTDGPREGEVNLALSDSFGFGGHNACLLVGKV